MDRDSTDSWTFDWDKSTNSIHIQFSVANKKDAFEAALDTESFIRVLALYRAGEKNHLDGIPFTAGCKYSYTYDHSEEIRDRHYHTNNEKIKKTDLTTLTLRLETLKPGELVQYQRARSLKKHKAFDIFGNSMYDGLERPITIQFVKDETKSGAICSIEIANPDIHLGFYAICSTCVHPLMEKQHYILGKKIVNHIRSYVPSQIQNPMTGGIENPMSESANS